jgi:hypothetical protein
MKNPMRDSAISAKRPQYSSRIMVTPSANSSKGAPKLTYSRRGNSQDPYKENQQNDDMNLDNENMGVASLITQSTKNGRPLTGGALIYAQQQQQSNVK